MKPIPFKSKTTPWYVALPVGLTGGKRKSIYFRSRPAADAFCRKASKPGFQLEQFVPVLSKIEQDEFSIAGKRFAALYGGDLSRAYLAHERLKKLANIKPATVRESIEAFQVWRETEARSGKLKLSTVRTDFDRLNKLIAEFEVVQLADITTLALREFFDGIKGDKRSIYASVSKFFNWARRRGYLGENPVTDIEVKTEIGEYGVNNEYYPLATFRRMLRIAASLDPIKPGGEPTKDFIGMLPYFVIGGFLGLRRHEALRMKRNADALRWTDLHFDSEIPNVEVREDIAKTEKVRFIESVHYLEAFKSWLPFIPQDRPHIVPWTHSKMQKLKAAFTKATKIKFIENGFRNSFATYALTYNGLQGVGKLSVEMGNTEEICKRHYVRNIAPGSGKAWFSLRPFEVVSSGSLSAQA
jgi:integrase